MIKAVIFDLDDTIITSDQHIQPGLVYVFSQHKDLFPGISFEEFLSANRKAIHQLLCSEILLSQMGILIWYRMFELLGMEPSPHEITVLYHALQAHILKHISLQPGFVPTLDWLKKKNIKVGVLSNGSFIERARKIRKVGIDQEISVLLSTDLVGKDKPHPQPFLAILKLLEIQPEEALFIGDSVSEDIEGAKAVGIKPVLFISKNKKYDGSVSDKLEYQIKSHKELIPIIKNINKNDQSIR